MKLGSDDKEKSIYLTQIGHLDEQLERCQLKCDELEKQNKDLVSLKSALEKDKKDIMEYLKYTAAALEKKVDELMVLLEKQQQVAKQDKELLKQQHSQETQKLQEQLDKLNTVKRKLVTTSEKQEVEKERLMELMQQLPDMESLEKQLLKQQEEHKAAVHSLTTHLEMESAKILEMQNAEEKCIEVKISEMLQEGRAETRKQLEKVQTVLYEMLELLKQKNELQDRESDMCFDMDELKEKLNRVKLQMFTYEKEMEQLKNKFQSLVDNIKNCRVNHKHVLLEEDALRLCLASMSEKCYIKTVEADHLRSELQEESSRRRQLERSVQKAAITLRHNLMDSEKLSVKKMQRLLKTLEISAPEGAASDLQGAGSDLSDSTESSSQEQEPKPDRAETQDLATDPLFLMARYNPGDLGLVPRPTWKHKPNLVFSGGMLSPSAHQLPLNRKPYGQKTPSSVNLSALAPQQDDAEAGAPVSKDF